MLTGTWGHTVFDNDAAMDWLAADYAEDGAAAVLDVLGETAAMPLRDTLNVDMGSAAWAAAEIVGAAIGRPAADLPRAVSEHLGAVKGLPGIRDLALKALARLTAGHSELAALWSEDAALAAQWTATIDDLRQRLKG